MVNVFFRLPPGVNNFTPEEIYQTYGNPELEQVIREMAIQSVTAS
jgi:hypothetical protein